MTEQITNRFLITEYTVGDAAQQQLALFFLQRFGGWMFEDGTSHECNRK